MEDDRRSSKRLAMHLKAWFRPLSNSEQEFESAVLNVSHRGVCLSSPEPIDEGTQLQVKILLEKGHIVEIQGEVRWVSLNEKTSTHILGLKLEESSRDDLERFQQFYNLRLLTTPRNEHC